MAATTDDQAWDNQSGIAAAAAAAAATAGAIAKVAAAAEAAATVVAAQDEAVHMASGDGTRPSAEGVRFFLRGVGKLQEHHLRDYFQRFADVVEVALVRDKKTQRPRGMAFVTLSVRAVASGDDSASSVDVLVERLTTDSHAIDGVELEVHEALPNPKEEGEAAGAAATEGVPAATDGAAAAAPQEPPPPALDPAAQAQAQAQWQMHYLSLAINASVPEVGNLVPKQPPSRPPSGLSRHPGAVPKGAPYGPSSRRPSPY